MQSLWLTHELIHIQFSIYLSSYFPYNLKVIDETTGNTAANISSVSPDVLVTDLAPGRDYLIQVRGYNAKGVSGAVTLQGFALKVAENKIRESRHKN